MSFLGSRFTFNSSRGQFHSSGMTNGDSVTGSTSGQSFEKRQEIEKNRQVIAAYRDAAVTRVYRNDAFSPDSSQKKHYGADVQEDLDEQKSLHRKNSSQLDVDQLPSSKISRVRSSRIDIVMSSRQDVGAGNSTTTPNGMASRQMAPKTSFREPTSRRYNPYS